MEDIRKQLEEDLTDLLQGELRTDDVTRALYSTDASLHEVKPLAVVHPASTQDVSTLATYASEHEIPLIPRGAGTGLAGGCLGQGLVIDFSRHMNRILSIDGSTVRVQPGVTLSELNARLREYGRYFAPDPSSSEVTTIGGMVGVDAAGSHAFRVGSTRDHVVSLECVMIGGQVIQLGLERLERSFPIRQPVTGVATPEPVSDGILPPVRNETLALTQLTPATRKMDLLERLSALLTESTEAIRKHQPAMLRNCSGYMLRHILHNQVLNLPRLLTGSEGTLAMVTEVTLHTMPLPQERGMTVLMFASMDDALEAMQMLLTLEPSACDLLDRRLLSLGRDSDPRYADIIHPDAEAGLFVEFNGSSLKEIQARFQHADRILNGTEFRFLKTHTTTEVADVELLWSLPENVVSLLAGLKGASRPLPFVEDIAVPPEEISGFLKLAQKTFQKHEVTATLYAHAASGQLHLRPMLPNPTPQMADLVEAIARDLYRHVKTVGGTISGEHGDGLSRTAFIRTQYGPLYRTFQQVKEIFDPQGLLNPDKIISNDGQLTVRHLRKVQPQQEQNETTQSTLPILQLTWDAQRAMDAASRCNGCGSCRTTSPDQRMCPFFRDERVEENAPRGKANLLRRLISGTESADIMAEPSVKRVSESCFNCKQCQIECPSEVDIPHLMLEARAQNVATHGLSNTDWLLSRFHTYARFASRFRIMANRMLRYGMFRGILQKTIGIAERRRLPRFAKQQFLRSPRVLSEHNVADPTTATPTVVYFVDYFANNHDPDLAEAFVRILQHHGYRVYIPPTQTVSGMAMVNVGDLEAAREVAETNISLLSEPAREGYPIVCTEPAAALCLSQEYPMIVSGRDAEIVAERTSDAGSFLWQLYKEGKLKTDFEALELSVGYHTPCHVKALGPETGLRSLLELIPGVTVKSLDKGCSGMAGTFGLASEHFEQSLEIGRNLIDEMQTTDVKAGTSDCSSCRMQMEQEATIPTVHPIKIIALAYGLMPELAKALKSRPFGTVMS